jgi:aryl-alcohol dehydrogenase-like predicted oxidoreductase
MEYARLGNTGLKVSRLALGCSALAWVLANPAVSAPIVGATRPHHLPDAVAALDLHLTAEEVQAMEEPYTQHGPSWF